jgi:hypothetical protein
MSMLVFWVVTPCGLVGRYQRIRRDILPPSSGLTYWRQCVLLPKCWYLPASKHGVATQKTKIVSFYDDIGS